MKKIIAALLMCLGLSLPMVGSQVEAAYPYNCSTNLMSYNESGAARCTSGGGWYKVIIRCGSFSNYQNYWYSGTWQSGGRWSTRRCPYNYIINGIGYQTRSW